jgi:hypothetical protein
MTEVMTRTSGSYCWGLGALWGFGYSWLRQGKRRTRSTGNRPGEYLQDGYA